MIDRDREPPAARPPEAAGVYLYGVVRPAALASLKDAGLCGDGPLAPVTHQDVAALTSRASVQADREALARHADLVQRVFERTTILPARFGIVLPDAERVVAELLAPYHDQLVAELDRLDGMAQVGVTGIHREQPALARLLRGDRALAAHRRDATGSYAAAIRLGQYVAAGLERMRAQDAATAVDVLGRHAVDAYPSASSHEHMFLHASFLVRAVDIGAFDDAVGELRRLLPHAVIRAVGPQPPYAFVQLHPRQEPAWA